MGRALTEAQVLKKLDIVDFRHLTKEKVMSMATMLDKMDPDVAKKALEQFPDFANTMRQILSEYQQLLNEAMLQNSNGVKSYYDTCDVIIATCQKELAKENLSFEERSFILEQMMTVAKMKGDKNSEDKRFIATMCVIGLTATGLVASALLTALGGNLKFDADPFKKLTN
jgi:hypothetical protein